MKSYNIYRFCLTLIFIICVNTAWSGTQVLNGVLDMSTFTSLKASNMDGEWEFYQNQYLYAEDFKKNDREVTYAAVPGIFNDLIQDSKGKGFATYRLTLILDSIDEYYSLLVKKIPTAYVIYLNGKKIAQTGIPGTNKSSTTPAYSSSMVDLRDARLTNELIFHVANFHGDKGGIWSSVKIGPHQEILRIKTKAVRHNTTLIALLAFMGLYHLALHLVGRNRKASLAFGVLCLVFALRIYFTDEMLVLDVFPQIPWIWVLKIEFMTFYSSLGVFSIFLYSQYTKLTSKLFHGSITALSFFFTFITLLTPLHFYIVFMNPHKILIILSIIYYSIIMIKAVRSGLPGVKLSLTGITFLYTGAILDLVITTLKYDGPSYFTPYGIIALIFFESLTMFKQLSEANKKEKILTDIKSRFISTASHEFRTPLAIIQLSSDTLQRLENKNISPERRKEYFNNIDQSVIRIMRIMDDVLALGSQQYGTEKFKLILSDIRLLCETAIQEYNLEKRDIIFSETGTAFHYKVDRDSFNRMMGNLILNAVKYSDPDTSIYISLQYKDKSLTINITNTGIGIPLKDQAHIFDDFYRGDNVNERPGTGLGLSIVKSIVDKHNGTISVQSIPAKNTTFTIILPRV